MAWHEAPVAESLLLDQSVFRHYEWVKGLPEITYSCVEKAYLEVLNEMPKHVSFEHADALLQGYITCHLVSWIRC